MENCPEGKNKESNESINEEEENRKKWDKCIKQATWRIGLGMLVGGLASAMMGGNEMPLRYTTGLVAAWSFNSCRRTITAKPPPPSPPSSSPPDPCECCTSDYQPLILDQFEGCKPEKCRDSADEEPFRCECEAADEVSLPPCQPSTQQGSQSPDFLECTCNER